MNSLAVPRKAKEAIGGIAALRRPDGTSLTINVEYNLLDPLLRANGYPDGDVNDATGWSPFPGMHAQHTASCALRLLSSGPRLTPHACPRLAARRSAVAIVGTPGSATCAAWVMPESWERLCWGCLLSCSQRHASIAH